MTISLDNFKDEILAALNSNTDVYHTAYQVVIYIQKNYPLVWQQLVQEYGQLSGQGSGSYNSPAKYIAHALGKLAREGLINQSGLSGEGLNSIENMIVEDYPWLSIWKVKES